MIPIFIRRHPAGCRFFVEPMSYFVFNQQSRRSEASSGIAYSTQRFALYVLIKRLQSALIPFVTTQQAR